MIIFQYIMLLFQMLLRYFTLLLLAAGQLSYLSKLMKEEQKYENTMVGKLASRHKHQASDAVQHQGSDALQQEGSNAVQIESSDAVQLEGYDAGQQDGYDAVQQEDSSVGQQEGNPRRHPRNISIPRLPPQNPENTLAQRLQELVAKYQEVSESIMPAVSRARQVIEGDTSDINFRDSTIRTVFFVSFLHELLGFATELHLDLNRSLSTTFWRLMSTGNYYVLFSWTRGVRYPI